MLGPDTKVKLLGTEDTDRDYGRAVAILTAPGGGVGIALTDEQWADYPLGAELKDDERISP